METAEASGTRVRILKGLKGGDTLATEGVYSLTDGMQVKVVTGKPEAGGKGAEEEEKK